MTHGQIARTVWAGVALVTALGILVRRMLTHGLDLLSVTEVQVIVGTEVLLGLALVATLGSAIALVYSGVADTSEEASL